MAAYDLALHQVAKRTTFSGMYCPVDGDEFQEGVTRCPEHDVQLVEDQPVLQERLSWIDRFNDRTAVRLSFLVLAASALVYALSGFVTALLYLLIQHLGWEAIDTVQVFQQVQSAAFPVGLAALGTLAGALLLRTYPLVSETGVIAAGSSDPIRLTSGRGRRDRFQPCSFGSFSRSP